MATDLIESCTKEEQVNVACEEVKESLLETISRRTMTWCHAH